MEGGEQGDAGAGGDEVVMGGRNVASGLYDARFVAETEDRRVATKSRRMTLLR